MTTKPVLVLDEQDADLCARAASAPPAIDEDVIETTARPLPGPGETTT